MDSRTAQDRADVARAREGDHEAFVELVARYQRLVASVAWRHGFRDADLEDVVSEVFVKLYANLDRYRPDHAFATWLYRLAANHAVDRRRRRKHDPSRIEMSERLTDDRPRPDEAAAQRERAEHIREAMAEVKPVYREAMELVYLEDRSVGETAILLGVPQGTVKSRLLRGREALRKLVERRFPGAFGSGASS